MMNVDNDLQITFQCVIDYLLNTVKPRLVDLVTRLHFEMVLVCHGNSHKVKAGFSDISKKLFCR